MGNRESDDDDFAQSIAGLIHSVVLVGSYLQLDCTVCHFIFEARVSVVFRLCLSFSFIQDTIHLINDQSEAVSVWRTPRHGSQPLPTLGFVGQVHEGHSWL
jgi:hypothetical protein